MGFKFLVAILFVSSVFILSNAADANAWRSRSIYQVLTDRIARTNGDTSSCGDLGKYCGGTFKGLQNKLDYIKSMGFDAIWISPIPKNQGQDYHGYGAVDWYQVNSNFGTPQDLKNLVSAAHSKGMYVMLDVVANHVGSVDLDFSKVVPFNSPSHYHTKCQINNWNDAHEVEYCRLANLPDLDQDNSYVRQTLLNWVKGVVSNYSFDGIRVDTVPEVKPQFWAEWAKAAGVYQVGEVFNRDYGYVGKYQGYLDATLNYPLYYALRDIFGSRQSMYNFRNHYSNMDKFFKNQDILGNFVDNHDNPRYLNQYSDGRTYKAALAFVLGSKGIPIIYYGSEQYYKGGNDPGCREPLWTSGYKTTDISTMLTRINQVRKDTKYYLQPQVERWVDDTFYAFSRGNVVFAFTNNPDQTQTRSVTYHPYKEGQKVCNIVYPGDCVTIKGGALPVTLLNGEVKVFVPQSMIKQKMTDDEVEEFYDVDEFLSMTI